MNENENVWRGDGIHSQLDVTGAAAPNVPDNELQRAADRQVRTVALPERASAPTADNWSSE